MLERSLKDHCYEMCFLFGCYDIPKLPTALYQGIVLKSYRDPYHKLKYTYTYIPESRAFGSSG